MVFLIERTCTSPAMAATWEYLVKLRSVQGQGMGGAWMHVQVLSSGGCTGVSASWLLSYMLCTSSQNGTMKGVLGTTTEGLLPAFRARGLPSL
jgi:hypothetical protein